MTARKLLILFAKRGLMRLTGCNDAYETRRPRAIAVSKYSVPRADVVAVGTHWRGTWNPGWIQRLVWSRSSTRSTTDGMGQWRCMKRNDTIGYLWRNVLQRARGHFDNYAGSKNGRSRLLHWRCLHIFVFSASYRTLTLINWYRKTS